MYKPADPSLGLMRADIGAASLSLFGDPYELDPFDRWVQRGWALSLRLVDTPLPLGPGSLSGFVFVKFLALSSSQTPLGGD